MRHDKRRGVLLNVLVLARELSEPLEESPQFPYIVVATYPLESRFGRHISDLVQSRYTGKTERPDISKKRKEKEKE